MKDSEAYKQYYAVASGAEPPKAKTKYKKKADKPVTHSKSKTAPASKGSGLKSPAKVTKSGKKKIPAQGLETLSETTLSEAEQMKVVTKRSKTDYHISHASGSGANEGTGVTPGTEFDNDGDDFIHPKFSTHDEEVRQDKEDKDEECLDLRVHTPSHFESTNDETYDEVTQGDNVEEEKWDEEQTSKEEEVNELYNDVNINLEGRDTEMTDALLANSSSVSSGFISNMLNLNPDAGIDSILNLNIESTSLIDVLVTINDEIPPLSVTTLPPQLIPLIQPLQQTLVSTPTIALTVSSITGIIDKYLANKMNEAVKAAVQLQSDRLREEAHAKNKDFINKIDENIKKIIKEQVIVQVKEQVSKILPRIKKSVSEQLEAEVLIRSSNKAKTSHAIAANISKLELKKILIDKMENNKSIDRSVQQKTLYKALVDTYETDKDILATYGDTVMFKRRRDDEDEDEEPSAGSNRGSREEELEKNLSHLSTGKFAQAEEPIHTVKDLEEPAHQEFNTGFTQDHPVDETTMIPDWFQKPSKPPTPDRDWNKTLPAIHGPIQPWISTLAQNKDPREIIKMKGSCKSLVELEYFLEEVCKATTYQLDWNNPEGHQYPHDLRKPLPLIPNSRGRRVIPFDHFINNDLEYLSGGVSSRTYPTSVTKIKAADYGHIKWIEDLVPNTMWSQVPIFYDKHALWGISHWGRKHQQFYGYAVNRESARDVYSRNKIIAIKKLMIVEWHNYKHLEWITIPRDDNKVYTFKEGEYNRLRLQDIKDILLLLVQGKLTNLNIEECLALGVSL
ncbi:hypothetical protein Tco_1017332 [Tanacetum coccineum]|uniref:Uncharacterized protein n=1 Tax=Tanacetum coccineum TaxID=301880 RepID=A0ABQ5FR64_9ASTR